MGRGSDICVCVYSNFPRVRRGVGQFGPAHTRPRLLLLQGSEHFHSESVGGGSRAVRVPCGWGRRWQGFPHGGTFPFTPALFGSGARGPARPLLGREAEQKPSASRCTRLTRWPRPRRPLPGTAIRACGSHSWWFKPGPLRAVPDRRPAGAGWAACGARFESHFTLLRPTEGLEGWKQQSVQR